MCLFISRILISCSNCAFKMHISYIPCMVFVLAHRIGDCTLAFCFHSKKAPYRDCLCDYSVLDFINIYHSWHLDGVNISYWGWRIKHETWVLGLILTAVEFTLVNPQMNLLFELHSNGLSCLQQGMWLDCKRRGQSASGILFFLPFFSLGKNASYIMLFYYCLLTSRSYQMR